MDECSSQGAAAGRLSVVEGGLGFPGSRRSPKLLALPFLGVTGSSCMMALLQILASAGNGGLAFSSSFILGWAWAGTN